MSSKTTNKFSPELRVRAVQDHAAEVDSGRKPGLTTDAAARLQALEREVPELRQANEILRKASAPIPRSCQSSVVLDALEQALHARRPVHRGGLVHHSDRGSHYVSTR